MTIQPKDPRVEFVFLARYLEPAFPGGSTLNVTELGFHDLYAAEGKLPAYWRLWIVGRIHWRSEDTDRKFRIKYSVRAFNDNSEQPSLVGSYPVTIEAGQPSPFPHHSSGLMPAQFASYLDMTIPAFGTYVVDVLLDGMAIASAPFALVPPDNKM